MFTGCGWVLSSKTGWVVPVKGAWDEECLLRETVSEKD